MAEAFSQKNRSVRLMTHQAFDADGSLELVIDEMTVDEGIARLYDIRIVCDGSRPDLDLADCIGKKWKITCLGFQADEEKRRYFHGIVTEARRLSLSPARYEFTLRPPLWQATRLHMNVAYHDVTMVDLISKIASKYQNIVNCAFRTIQREYVVRYNETDYNFMSRLMEKHGFYYYFHSSEGTEHFNVIDQKSQHTVCVSCPQIRFAPDLSGTERNDFRLTHVQASRRYDAMRFWATDYDFKKPSSGLFSVENETPQSTPNDDFRNYQVFAGFDNSDDGHEMVTAWRDAYHAHNRLLVATGNCVHLEPGTRTKLHGHGDKSLNTEYLVVSARHYIRGQSTRSGGKAGAGFQCVYELLDANLPFKLPQTTPRPVIHGVQVAKVIDRNELPADEQESGPKPPVEEIDVDEHGRILVAFMWHWTPAQSVRSASSMRVRVAQMWAGQGWGTQFIPRVGQEVVVTFIDGDPDRPLVVGAVYNGDNKHPYELEAKKTQSGIKTRSTKKGSDNNFNELMFEDKKGSELVRFQAERNLQSLIKADEARSVGNNRKTSIGKDNTLNVDGDHVTNVKGRTVVSTDKSTTIFSKEKITIQSMQEIELICGASSITIGPTSVKIQTIEFSHTSISYKQNWMMGETTGMIKTQTVPLANLTTALTNHVGVVKATAYIGPIPVPAPPS